MATIVDAAGGAATCEINQRVFTLAPISQREEMALWKQWEAIAREGDKARLAKTYEAIAMAPTPELRKAGMDAIVQASIAGTPLDDSVVLDARRSARGVHAELYARTRKFHAGVGLEEIQALVNETNAEESCIAIVKAVAALNPNGQTP